MLVLLIVVFLNDHVFQHLVVLLTVPPLTAILRDVLGRQKAISLEVAQRCVNWVSSDAED